MFNYSINKWFTYSSPGAPKPVAVRGGVGGPGHASPRAFPPVTCVSDSRRRRRLAEGRGQRGRSVSCAPRLSQQRAPRVVQCSWVRRPEQCGAGGFGFGFAGSGLRLGMVPVSRLITMGCSGVLWSERPGEAVESSISGGVPVCAASILACLSLGSAEAGSVSPFS